MATTLPADATKANTDQGTDDPKQALLTDLAGMIDKFNSLKTALGAAALLSLDPSGALEAITRTGGTPDDIAVKLQTNPGLVKAASGIKLLLQSNSGLVLGASGLKLNINGLTAITDPAKLDTLAMHDLSPAGSKQITMENFFKVINGLTVDATPDPAADFVVTYDASTGVPKKVLLQDILGIGLGGLEHIITKDAATDTSVVFSASDITGFSAYMLRILDLYTSAAGIPKLKVGNSGGILSTSYSFTNLNHIGIHTRGIALVGEDTGGVSINMGTEGWGNNPEELGHLEIVFSGMNDANKFFVGTYLMGGVVSTSLAQGGVGGFSRFVKDTYTQIEISMAGSNFNGKLALYGIRT